MVVVAIVDVVDVIYRSPLHWRARTQESGSVTSCEWTRWSPSWSRLCPSGGKKKKRFARIFNRVQFTSSLRLKTLRCLTCVSTCLCAYLIGEELHDEVALSLNFRRTRPGLKLEPLVKAVHG